MAEQNCPVLIVGAGAAGLTAATLLAHHGIQALLVERRREIFIYPKARNLNFRSLEILRAIGLGSSINAVAEHMSTMVSKRTLSDAEVRRVWNAETPTSANVLSPEPFARYCPQSKLEPILLTEARRLGCDVRYGVELMAFREDDVGVVATIKDLDSGTAHIVHTKYLIAADGTHSRTRRRLGISTAGFGRLPIFNVFIYFRAPWQQFVPELREADAVQITKADVAGLFLAARGDLALFMYSYSPRRGETADLFTPTRCHELLLRAIGTPIDIEIVEIVPWQPYEQVAEQFRCGRIFLVGDSAHAMPAFKGGGANTAIASAHNLAWKLAAVLNGAAGPGLLDTYQAERHPVGRFAARQSLTGPSASFLELTDYRPTLGPEEERPVFYMIAGYKYRSHAVVSDEPMPADPDQAQLVAGEQLSGEPGTRLPHAWVQRNGQRLSTLDLHDGGLRLFIGAGGTPWISAVSAVATSLALPIEVYRIGAEDGPKDTICDLDGQWARLSGLPPEGALLVRPDDFIAWRASTLPPSPAQELGKVIRQILVRD